MEKNTTGVISLSNAKIAEKLCNRVAFVFLALWFIVQVTDILGTYEYPAYFLGLVFLFFLAGSIFGGMKYRATVKKVAYGIAKATFLIWLFIKIGGHFDWVGFTTPLILGEWSWTWIEYSQYVIIAFFASILIGYTAGKHKRGIRTVMYGIGFVGIAFWIFVKLLDLIPEYQTAILIGSIGAVAIGYVAGVFEEERRFRWVHEVEEAEEIHEPKIQEEAQVLTDDCEIKKGKTTFTMDKGSIFVPIANGEEIGGVFFGQGSYVVDAEVKKYINVFQGITALTGKKWNATKKNIKLQSAEDKDFDTMGLKKEEIFDLARIQIEEREWKKIGKKFKKNVTNFEMPFIKVRESEDGEYVKVGPIEVVGKGKGSRVKMGPFTFNEGMDIEWENRRLYDLSAKIRTKDKEISLKVKDDRATLREDDRLVVSTPGKVIVEDGDVKLKIKGGKRILKTNDLKIYEREEKTILKTPKTKIVLNDEVKITQNGKMRTLKNPRMRRELQDAIDKLIRDALDKKEMEELDDLLTRLEKE